MPDEVALYVDVALLAVLVPVAFVPCQYQVSPPGAEPVAVMVTPGLAHCGESDVGVPGVAGVAQVPCTVVKVCIALLHPVTSSTQA